MTLFIYCETKTTFRNYILIFIAKLPVNTNIQTIVFTLLTPSPNKTSSTTVHMSRVISSTNTAHHYTVVSTESPQLVLSLPRSSLIDGDMTS